MIEEEVELIMNQDEEEKKQNLHQLQMKKDNRDFILNEAHRIYQEELY